MKTTSGDMIIIYWTCFWNWMEILPKTHFFGNMQCRENVFILLGGILSSCRYKFWQLCVTCKGWKRRSSKRQVVQTSISPRSMTLRLGWRHPNMRTLFPTSNSSAFELIPWPCSGRLWTCIDFNSNSQAKMMDFASWIDKFCPVNTRPALTLSMSREPEFFLIVLWPFLQEVWIESFEGLFKRLFEKESMIWRSAKSTKVIWHCDPRFTYYLRNFEQRLLTRPLYLIFNS